MPFYLDIPPLFTNHLPVWQQIMPHIHKKILNKNTTVIHHGDYADTLWLVLNGWVKLTRQTPNGKETIIRLCANGDIFGTEALLPHTNYPYHAEAITINTELATIPSDIIRNAINKNTSFAVHIMSLLNEYITQTQLKLEHTNTMSAMQRLGCFLLRLCNDHEGDRQTIQIPIEKHLLATYLGMKPETLSRSQKQMKSLGIIVRGSQIEIASVAKLHDFVCDNCSDNCKRRTIAIHNLTYTMTNR